MQQDSDYRLEFDVVTPRYLGNPDVAKICVEEVGRLPRKLWPTKTEDSTFKKSRFSFHDPRAFELAVPGTAPFDGYARLYKVRDVFSFHLFWSKGSEEWYRENPGQKFNRAGMSVRDGQAAVGQSRSFARIQSVWLNLLVRLDAAYGFVYLRDAKARRTTPRGQGRCLPRLHWQTYFNAAYVRALNLAGISNTTDFQVRSILNGGTLITLNGDPRELSKPNAIERAVIARLGPTYFWGYTDDDWRSPQAHYDMPRLDWSEVVVE